MRAPPPAGVVPSRHPLAGVTLILAVAGTLGAAGSPAPAHAPAEVAIREYAFDPTPRSVRVGTRVTWVNYDVVPHTAKGGAGLERWDSGVLPANTSYSRTFGIPGTYRYLCPIHPGMQGTIIVQ